MGFPPLETSPSGGIFLFDVTIVNTPAKITNKIHYKVNLLWLNGELSISINTFNF